MFPSVIVFVVIFVDISRCQQWLPLTTLGNHKKKSYRFVSLDRRSSRAKLPHHFRWPKRDPISRKVLAFVSQVWIFHQEKHTEIGWVAIVACRWLTFWCGLLSLQARYSIQVLLVAHPKRDSLLRWAYETSLLHQLVAVDFNCLAIWALD